MGLNIFIGRYLILTGGKLWADKGRNNNKEYYEDLTVVGKVGYKMFRSGLYLMGITPENFDEFIEYVFSERDH